MFSSVVAAPPQEAPQPAPQPYSVVYLSGQMQVPQPAPQPIYEIRDQLNRMKCVISDMKAGISDLKISNNEVRHELAEHRGQLNELMAKNGYRKKPKKNQGLCMQGTILAVVVLIIGVVLGSYLTVGLPKN
jgi:TolA-binding protein